MRVVSEVPRGPELRLGAHLHRTELQAKEEEEGVARRTGRQRLMRSA